MDDVTEFLARRRGRRGKLGVWQDDIVALRRAGASYLAICDYLAEHNVTAQSGEVYRFMQRCGRPKLVKPDEAPPKPSPMQSESSTDGLPKFEWKPGKSSSSW